MFIIMVDAWFRREEMFPCKLSRIRELSHERGFHKKWEETACRKTTNDKYELLF